jgi:hypothetical protein
VPAGTRSGSPDTTIEILEVTRLVALLGRRG